MTSVVCRASQNIPLRFSYTISHVYEILIEMASICQTIAVYVTDINWKTHVSNHVGQQCIVNGI